MQYRSEVDGLRAFAVLAVILYHAGLPLFSGGFVGVDVFFVISGYLITGLILADKEAGTFSLVRFYERRARRILPALFLVMAVCVPFAWVWLRPSDMRAFGESLVAVPLFWSNLLFWNQTGYFESAAEFKPLLHTWSLAVEEQFYLVFPLVMAMSRGGRGRVTAMLAALALASLTAAQWSAVHAPTSAFFLLPFRAWELLAGALLAFGMRGSGLPSHRHPSLRACGGLLGLLGLAYAIVAFDRSMPFPGLNALAPALATLLVIGCAAPDNMAGKLLGSRPFVLMGLISYSAYLWHQPLFAFARVLNYGQPSGELLLGLAAASLGLALATWYWVERPFREHERVTRRGLAAFAALGTCVFVGFGSMGYATAGTYFRTHMEAQLQDVEARLRPNLGLAYACESPTTFLPEQCWTSPKPEVLVWGDSYAMHLVDGLLASDPHVAMMQATASSCGPFFDVAPVGGTLTQEWAHECLERNNRLRSWLRSHPGVVKYAILSSRFDRFTSGHAHLMLASGEVQEAAPHVLEHFRRTLETLRELGIVPIVVAPPPSDGRDHGRCAASTVTERLPAATCNFRLAPDSAAAEPIRRFLREVERKERVVWLDDVICPDGVCTPVRGGVFIYRDDGHLSNEGSVYLGRKLDLYRLVRESR